MLNPLSFISKIFKSSNDIELAKFRKILEKINLLENDVAKIKDSDFPNKTNELKNQIKSGKKLDEVLPEAFAYVREASHRSSCLLYTSPSPRDKRQSRMPSSA